MEKKDRKTKDKPKAPDWKWKSFTPEEYQAEIGRGVHFTIKGVNTNAAACGVRLGLKSGRSDPYISMVTTLSEECRFPLDYTSNRGSLATVFKQVSNVAGWDDAAPHPDTPPAERAATLEALRTAQATNHLEQEEGAPISPRARQVLFPDGQNGYVALIPLSAPAFAGAMHQRWQAWREARESAGSKNRLKYPLRRAFMGFGGTNPQNAGRLIRQMQTPFVFSGPTENPEVRSAYAIHFRGASLRLPPEQMQAYRTWREQIVRDGHIPTEVKLREQEAAILAELSRILLHRGQRARDLLEKYKEKLPNGGEPLLDPGADPVPAGLVEPSQRPRGWPRAFAEQLARFIAEHKFTDGRTLALDAPAVRQLAQWIEDEVRHASGL